MTFTRRAKPDLLRAPGKPLSVTYLRTDRKDSSDQDPKVGQK